jgi:nitroimidazol reductase NimA-like FMN-containing flavoprotein (pyridoxamine 5'-phosphate oxidase superfamily)
MMGKAAGSVVAHDLGMSFDNAYATPTYYVIAAEHDLRVHRAQRGESPRRGRRIRRRST